MSVPEGDMTFKAVVCGIVSYDRGDDPMQIDYNYLHNFGGETDPRSIFGQLQACPSKDYVGRG